MINYEILNKQAIELLTPISHEISLLANASALLNMHLENINWVGFYLAKDDTLVLGPFQGLMACTEIKRGKGVCGKAFLQNETILVDNVHDFDGHIACDNRSNSEIVIPISKGNQFYGVLDIDSYLIANFSNEDKIGLEKFTKIIEKILLKFI